MGFLVISRRNTVDRSPRRGRLLDIDPGTFLLGTRQRMWNVCPVEWRPLRGNPALIDTSSDLLHPVVALPVLLFGELNRGNSHHDHGWIRILVACVFVGYRLDRATVRGVPRCSGRIYDWARTTGLVVLMTSLATASFLLPNIGLLQPQTRSPSDRIARVLSRPYRDFGSGIYPTRGLAAIASDPHFCSYGVG